MSKCYFWDVVNICQVAVAEWLVRPSAMQEVCGSNPTSAETRMMGKQPAAILAIYTGRGVTPEHTPLQSSNKAEPTLALKPRGDITRSPKQGDQWP